MAGDSSVQGGGVLTGLVPGSQVAGYLLERRVGVGGTAAVFRARDERLGRVVALKLLTAELTADEGFRKRFLREARAVAAVDHPHIIPVYEAGEADGVLFIAMRFVAGSDLRVVVGQEGGLSPERAAAFFSPVASALDAAHASGLVHRDVKPANILVDAGPGRPEHVYLSDFGLARGMLSSSGLTRAGQFVGTPDYAAPEQISGRAVDGRADQYSLACVAYMLLTGSVLFVRDQPMAVLYAHVFEPPPRVTKARIGRRSTSRRIEPEIDLRGPPTDPGVSRLHARLIAGPDGNWSVMDLGSTSGTLVNGSEIAQGEAVPLRDGDRINLGAWTVITMTCG